MSAHAAEGVLQEALCRHGERLALVDGAGGPPWSYARAGAGAARIAAGLAGMGVGPGDRVVILTPACVPAVLACWGAWLLHAVPVPVDPGWPPYLLEPVLAQCAPRLVLHPEGPPPAPDLPALPLADAGGRPSAPVRAWLERPGPAPAAGPADGSAPGAILFTSGSTGQPKGVVLARGALDRSARLAAETFAWHASDRLLNLAELHAMSGLRNTCLAAAAAGAAVVLAPPARRDHVLRLQACIQEHRATLLGAGPSLVRMALRLRDRLPADAWTPVRQIICTGGALAPEDARAFSQWTGVPVVDYYGLTETTGLCLAHTPATALECDGTLGWPRGAVCRVLDGAGRDCPPGVDGELVVAGPNLMLGYLGRPDLTAEVMGPDGFRTGDRARMLADGRVQLVGRIRHAIKTASTDLLFPEEVEGALAGHPDLLDAAAAGVAGADGAERMVAFLVPRAPVPDPARFLAEIHQYLGARLGRSRLPGSYRLAERIPRLASGKIDRQTLSLEARHEPT